jgi:hypothetical protein
MDRQRKAERASLSDPAFGPDSAAVALDNSLGDVGTESDASPIILGHLEKRHEHGFQLVGRDSDAGVNGGGEGVKER